MLRFIRKRLNDRGDGILTMSVILIPIFMISIAFSVDLTKATYVKQQFEKQAQDATSVGIRSIGVDGSLTADAPRLVVNEYQRFFNEENVTRESAFRSTKCSEIPKEKILGGEPTGESYEAPYMEITIYGGRNSKDAQDRGATWVFAGGELIRAPMEYVPSAHAEKQRSVKAVVWDTSPNYFFGVIGMPCQYVRSTVSSIAFGGNEELLENNYETPAPEEVESP